MARFDADKKRFLQEYQDVLAPYNLAYRVKLLSQLFARKLQAVLEPYGLTPAHWGVLCCLWQEDGVATITISQRLQQLGGTFTGVLESMEKQGLIRRERDAEDRRVWRVWLTETGEALRETLPPIVRELEKDLYGCLSSEELQQFSEMVDRMNDREP